MTPADRLRRWEQEQATWESGAAPEPMPRLVALPYALAEHEDEELVPDQPGHLDGEVVNLHAVLERTCVVGKPVLDVGDDRRLVRIERVQVDPAALRWQPKLTPLQRHWSVRASTQGRAQAKANRDKQAKTPV